MSLSYQGEKPQFNGYGIILADELMGYHAMRIMDMISYFWNLSLNGPKVLCKHFMRWVNLPCWWGRGVNLSSLHRYHIPYRI